MVSARFGVAGLDDFVRHGARSRAPENRAAGNPGGVLSSRTNRAAPFGNCAASETSATARRVSVAFLALAHDEQVAAALPLEDGFGRAFDRVRRAEPDARLERKRFLPHLAPAALPSRWEREGVRFHDFSSSLSSRFSRTSAGALPSKTNGPG